MGWQVWGESLIASDLTGTDVFTRIQFGGNKALLGIRTWLIFYDSPAFTELHMKLYSSNASNEPGVLIATSDSRTKSEIITLDNGVKEIYFTFAKIPVEEDTEFCLVLNGTGYSPAGSEHIAWRKAFPDPVYSGGFTPAVETLNTAPFEVYAIGADI